MLTIGLRQLLCTASAFLLLTDSFAQQATFDCLNTIGHIEIIPNHNDSIDSYFDRAKHIGAIQNSTSNFEIRFYTIPSITNGGQVTIISCGEGHLSARRVEYWFKPRKSYGKRKINKVRVTSLVPTESWQVFMDSLQSLSFFTMPTMEDIRFKMKKYMTLDDGRVVEKRSWITDGAVYAYEIKIGSKIRTFSYHSPMAWYRTYDNVDELKMADDIRNHFVTNLMEAEKRR